MYAGVPKTAPSRVRRAVFSSVFDRRVELGEPEVEDLRDLLAVLALAEVDVLGLEVAVDDADRVRLHEPLGDLADDAHRRLRVDEPHARHAVVERLALEELHRDERPAVLEAPRVVHLDDVGALHARGGARLAEEALDDDGGVRELGGEHLDGDALADVDVLRLVDGGHPPAPELARDPVLADEQGTDADLVLWLDGGHVRDAGRPRT